MAPRKRLGYWISEKKAKRLQISEILEELSALNIESAKIDLSVPLDEQGPFDVILHKLTDLIAQADAGNKHAALLVENVESYVRRHPGTILIDRLDCLRTVIDRYKTYSIINELATDDDVFIPAFVALTSNVLEDNLEVFRRAAVSFPCVCKPIVAHGSSSAHEVGAIPLKSVNAHAMTLVFNEKGLAECTFPCVAQSFVNHNAVLYKLFALGESYGIVERPSIKNLHASEDAKPIHFHSDDVSKPSSCSQLTFQESSDTENSDKLIHKQEILDKIVREIRKVLRLGLFGVDVVVDQNSGRHAIIDVNSFPGYEGVENLPGKLAAFIRSELDGVEFKHGCFNPMKDSHGIH